MTTAIKITHDNDLTKVKLNGFTDYQRHVEGLIEAVSLQFKIHNSEEDDEPTIYPATMWVNEEYLYQFNAQEHWNYAATSLASVGGNPHLLLQGIYGPVLVTGPPDPQGETTSITPMVQTLCLHMWNEVYQDLDKGSSELQYGTVSQEEYEANR